MVWGVERLWTEATATQLLTFTKESRLSFPKPTTSQGYRSLDGQLGCLVGAGTWLITEAPPHLLLVLPLSVPLWRSGSGHVAPRTWRNASLGTTFQSG